MDFFTFYKNLRGKISDKDGMLLLHNGIVKGKSRDNRDVEKVYVSVNYEKLDEIIQHYKKRKGISLVEVYIFEGERKLGEDIMYLGVAGDVRENVIETLSEILDRIKKEVTHKQEF